jgi:segregation and condensation protein A
MGSGASAPPPELGAPRPRLDVRTPVFEGPLELLLALAEREEVDIFEVSLSTITDAYLAEVARLDDRDPREMAEFLWLAARLLLVKSVRLLPGAESAGGDAELLDWEEDVRSRLLEYRQYRELAEGLMTRAATGETSYPAPVRPVEVEGQEEPLAVDALLVALQSILARVPPRPLVYQGRAWKLEDKLEAIRASLNRGPFDLVSLILDCEDRLEAVVTFVAVLELLRQGAIRVRQRRHFQELWVEAA